MATTLVISGVTSVGIFLSILLKPTVRLGMRIKDRKRSICLGLYWMIAAIGAICLLAFGTISPKEVWQGLTSDSAINPIKILTLFLSVTALSVFLDEVGFFRYLAVKSLSLVNGSQRLFFIELYLLVSLLTVFTSNDIVVLTFTPFICYYAKNADVDPIPYLVAEFVAANSLSLTLIIGNPTNIYLATAYGISFGDYFITMIIPALIAGLTGFMMTYLIFRKKLAKPISNVVMSAKIEDKPMLILGICALTLCTVLLAISSYVGFEMWYIALAFALILLTVATVYSLARKRKPAAVGRTLMRCPWELIPFVISMFVVVLAIDKHDITRLLAEYLDCGDWSILTYGASSFLMANVINNIPMSVLYSSIASHSLTNVIPAVYAAIVGSNIGAFLTPVGALAGIMWLNILKTQGVRFNCLSFIKYGAAIAIPTLLSTLGSLYLSLWLI